MMMMTIHFYNLIYFILHDCKTSCQTPICYILYLDDTCITITTYSINLYLFY